MDSNENTNHGERAWEDLPPPLPTPRVLHNLQATTKIKGKKENPNPVLSRTSSVANVGFFPN